MGIYPNDSGFLSSLVEGIFIIVGFLYKYKKVKKETAFILKKRKFNLALSDRLLLI